MIPVLVLSTAAMCTVDVYTLPAGHAVIDGRIYGATPVLGIEVEPGAHRLVVADENWANPRVISFTCEAGKRHVLKIALR